MESVGVSDRAFSTASSIFATANPSLSEQNTDFAHSAQFILSLCVKLRKVHKQETVDCGFRSLVALSAFAVKKHFNDIGDKWPPLIHNLLLVRKKKLSKLSLRRLTALL
jgi:hypothetical protein